MGKLMGALLLIGLVGCSTVGNASLATRDADWPPMTMTQSELLSELGPPTVSSTMATHDGTMNTLNWTHAHTEMNPGLFIPVVGLFVAASGNGITSASQGLTVVFDGNGKMISRHWNQSKVGP